jgi:hypothetical protein
MNAISVKTVSAKADARIAGVKHASAMFDLALPSGRSQNRLHTQKTLLEYLLCGRIGD